MIHRDVYDYDIFKLKHANRVYQMDYQHFGYEKNSPFYYLLRV